MPDLLARTIPRLPKLPDSLAPERPLVQMREDVRDDPAELALEGADARPLLGEHLHRLRAKERRQRLPVLGHAGIQADRPRLDVHTAPRERQDLRLDPPRGL